MLRVRQLLSITRSVIPHSAYYPPFRSLLLQISFRKLLSAFRISANYQHPLMLFSVRGGRKSKQTWGHFPFAMDGKRRVCTRYCPSVRMEIYVLRALFSVPRHGKVSKPEAIFRPPRMEKKTMRTLFSVRPYIDLRFNAYYLDRQFNNYNKCNWAIIY